MREDYKFRFIQAKQFNTSYNIAFYETVDQIDLLFFIAQNLKGETRKMKTINENINGRKKLKPV